MTKSRYWVEFIDCWDDDIQKSIYLYGESVGEIKTVMDEYDVVVIDNTETNEEPHWGSTSRNNNDNALYGSL